jgi:hypothetical protein
MTEMRCIRPREVERRDDGDYWNGRKILEWPMGFASCADVKATKAQVVLDD